MGDPFLRPDQGEDLGIRIEVDAIAHFAESRDRPPQLRSALVEGVLVKCRVLDVVLKAPDDRSGGGPVGIAHSQIDDVATRGNGGLLLLVNLGEEIGGSFWSRSDFTKGVVAIEPSVLKGVIPRSSGTRHKSVQVPASSKRLSSP